MTQEQHPQFLNFKCPDMRGLEEKCDKCPVNEAGYCDDFCDFIKKLGDDIEKKHSKSDELQFDLYQAQKSDEWMFAFFNALVEVEKKLPDYTVHTSFAGWINTIINRRMLDNRRDYSSKSQPLKYIIEQLDDCEILAGSESDLDRKIQYPFIPKDANISEKASSLLILNMDKKNLIKQLASMNSMAILVTGTSKPDGSIVAQVKSNDGVLIYYSGYENDENLKHEINRMLRIYGNTISLSAATGDENREIDLPDTGYQEKIEQYQDKSSLNHCLEMLLTSGKHGKCAEFLVTFLDVLREIESRACEQDQALFKGGSVKKKAVYEYIGKLTNRKIDAVKRQDIRCRKSIATPLRECMEGKHGGAGQ